MIPKSKTFDIIICFVLLFFNTYDPSSNQIFMGRVTQVKDDGKIVVAAGNNIHEYFMYGLDYSTANLHGYKTYLDAMIVGSNVRIVEIEKKAVVFWYNFNLNLQMIQHGFFNVNGCDINICDEWEMEAEKYKLQKKSMEKLYGPF